MGGTAVGRCEGEGEGEGGRGEGTMVVPGRTARLRLRIVASVYA
jgi:hypothetical protein